MHLETRGSKAEPTVTAAIGAAQEDQEIASAIFATATAPQGKPGH